MNNDCDGEGPHEPGEVRVLPVGGDGNALLCKRCYEREARFTEDRMRDTPGFEGTIPDWDQLRIYKREL